MALCPRRSAETFDQTRPFGVFASFHPPPAIHILSSTRRNGCMGLIRHWETGLRIGPHGSES